MAEDQDDTSLPVCLIQHPTGSDRLLIYQSGQGARVEFRFNADTLWLSEAEIGDLFGVTRQNVNLHLNNIYEEGELDRSTTCKYFLQVRNEGNREVRRKALLHDLNAIISVGYRVNSKQGTLFRRWATDKLVQFATQGFVIDVERLANPTAPDYFQDVGWREKGMNFLIFPLHAAGRQKIARSVGSSLRDPTFVGMPRIVGSRFSTQSTAHCRCWRWAGRKRRAC